MKITSVKICNGTRIMAEVPMDCNLITGVSVLDKNILSLNYSLLDIRSKFAINDINEAVLIAHVTPTDIYLSTVIYVHDTNPYADEGMIECDVDLDCVEKHLLLLYIINKLM